MSYSRMKETPFKQMVERWLESVGAWYIKYWAGAKYTKEGIPDILACIKGKFYGIELKGCHGKPSLLQIVNLRKIRDAGGIGVLLYPKDFERFTRADPAWYAENIRQQQEWFEKLTQ